MKLHDSREAIAVLGVLMTVSCMQAHQPYEFMRTAEADIAQVKGEYSLVILKPVLMTELFGEKWASYSLYYGYNRALVEPSGSPASVRGSMFALGKGHPILVISGTEWEDLICPIYSLDTREEVVLRIDLLRGSVEVERPVRVREDEAALSPDGRLFFRRQ